MPGLPIVQLSSEAWPENGALGPRALNTGWVLDQRVDGAGSFVTNASPTSSGYSITSSGDGTTGSGNSYWALQRPVDILQTGTHTYQRVFAASFGAGVTTVGLTTAGPAASTAAITSVAVGPMIPDSGLSVKRLVSRYVTNAALNVSNAVATTYVDFGGTFTASVTTIAGDQVCIRVQSTLRKAVGGNAQVVVDRGGTKLPAAGGVGSSVVINGGYGSDWPFLLEYWDSPGAGTFTYKPQVWTSDANTATAGSGDACQMIVEVWR